MPAMPTALTYDMPQSCPAQDREALIMEHLSQVKWIATRFHERMPESTNLEDLVSIGIIGLIQAIDNFDPSLNVKLKTYAEFKIRGAILDSVRGMDGIGTHHRKKVKQIQSTIQSLQQSLMRQPLETEIAASLGISLEEYYEWLIDVRGVKLGSLDAPTPEGSTLLHFVSDPQAASPEQQYERAELERLIAEAVAAMPQPEQVVLDLYFDKELSLREIGKVMNLHATRIHQLKTQAVLRLRAHLAGAWPGAIFMLGNWNPNAETKS